ncbi:TPA: ClpX C4-type zinc finger protein [Candidatus Scatousia excrementigallinarum]|uniref:ClpX C4-type zinc finger protein n=1 Tax=Candidatus Scatousia excrementigallinarum TaxID=2840935 RepID=A0A9D1EYS2_9BACT|nr:ClpX C4-type zinc finger protein [Candidatus Scatousia excrementigallinarum]
MSDDKVVKLGAKRSGHHREESNSAMDNEQEVVYCSFCKRPNTQVLKMVQGPGVNICSECAMIAVQYLILNDRMPSAEAQQILDAFWGKARK